MKRTWGLLAGGACGVIGLLVLHRTAIAWISWLPVVTVSPHRPPLESPQALLAQRYFTVVAPLREHPMTPAPPLSLESLLTPTTMFATSDPVARQWLVSHGCRATLTESTDQVKHLVNKAGLLGVIRAGDLTPDFRALGPFFPLQTWVSWRRSSNALVEQAGLNRALDHVIRTATALPRLELSPVVTTLIAVGDIMLGRSVEKHFQRSTHPLFPFQDVADRLSRSQVTVGNLECAITLTGTPADKRYVFRADPRSARHLADAGFSVVSLANNHGGDYGSHGVLQSLLLLSEAGVGAFGGGRNHHEASAPWITTLPNGTRLGFFGASVVGSSLPVSHLGAGIHVHEPAKFIREIREAKSQCDVLVVSLHWGEEYTRTSNAQQQIIARQAIDAGASIVIGHHPHWIQEVECYKGRLIVYSLGNFVFDQFFSDETTEGLVATYLLSGRDVIQFYGDPVIIEKGVPRFIDRLSVTPALDRRRARITQTLFPSPVAPAPQAPVAELVKQSVPLAP